MRWLDVCVRVCACWVGMILFVLHQTASPLPPPPPSLSFSRCESRAEWTGASSCSYITDCDDAIAPHLSYSFRSTDEQEAVAGLTVRRRAPQNWENKRYFMDVENAVVLQFFTPNGRLNDYWRHFYFKYDKCVYFFFLLFPRKSIQCQVQLMLTGSHVFNVFSFCHCLFLFSCNVHSITA